MSFYISLSGLKGAQSDLAAIANNIANVGVDGVQEEQGELRRHLRRLGHVGQHAQAGRGTRQIGATQQFTQGTLETTGKTLDMALTGEGFITGQERAAGEHRQLHAQRRFRRRREPQCRRHARQLASR